MFFNFTILFGLVLNLLSCSQPGSFDPVDSAQHNIMSPLHFFQNTEEIKNIFLKVKGTVPSWLSGQLVRNGPGIVENQGKFLNHWFDGFAKLHAFTFKQGRVTYDCKFLKSDPYQKFKSTGTFDFLGFDQQPIKDTFSYLDFLWSHKNEAIANANVNVAKLNNKRVALTEIPLPVEFDHQLNTVAPFEYRDDLPKKYSFESAHVLVDPGTKETWNFLIDIGLLKTSYKIYKIFADSNVRKLVCSIPVTSISYMHSFSLAGRYFVLIDYPLRAQNPQDLNQGFIKAFKWDAMAKTKVYVIDRDTGQYKMFLTDPFFSFHHINGFESNGQIMVDLIAYRTSDVVNKVNSYPSTQTSPSRLLRLKIDFTKGVENQTLTSEHFEFPRLNESFRTKDYRYFYALHTRPQGHGLVKYDHKGRPKYWYQEDAYAGEPVFVAHPQANCEDDGVILSIVNDFKAKKSFLLILDAKNLQEQARLMTPNLIPFGFHGQFFDD
ncbi:MAG: carotenoid oxygenase family protein [Janthinobacterium lividum]